MPKGNFPTHIVCYCARLALLNKISEGLGGQLRGEGGPSQLTFLRHSTPPTMTVGRFEDEGDDNFQPSATT